MRRFVLAHPFFREAVQLSLASAAAQVVALAFSPAVLRRYDAGAFGVSSILIAVSGSVGQLSCLKYDLALLSLPREREESPLLKAALISVAVSALLMGAAASIFGTSVNHILLMILTAAAVGCYTIGSAVCLRGPGPGLLGRAVLLRSALQAAAQLAFSGWGDQTAALLAAYLISYLGGCAMLFPNRSPLQRIGWRPAAQAAAEFREYPLLLLPGALAFHCAAWLHQGTVLRYDPASLGCYAIVERLLAAPMAMLSSAVGQLFLRWICGLPEPGRRPLYDRVSLSMLAIAGAACFCLYPAAPLIPRIFGRGWEGAVQIMRVLLPFFAVRFAVAPVASGLIAADGRRALACWQLLMLLLTSSAVLIANLRGLSLLPYLAAYGFLMTAGYLILWCWGRAALERRKGAV